MVLRSFWATDRVSNGYGVDRAEESIACEESIALVLGLFAWRGPDRARCCRRRTGFAGTRGNHWGAGADRAHAVKPLGRIDRRHVVKIARWTKTLAAF